MTAGRVKPDPTRHTETTGVITVSQESSSTTNGGIGFTGALTIAFIVLKLTHVIAWSWWWVLSPLWISFGLFLIFLAVVLLVTAVQS